MLWTLCADTCLAVPGRWLWSVHAVSMPRRRWRSRTNATSSPGIIVTEELSQGSVVFVEPQAIGDHFRLIRPLPVEMQQDEDGWWVVSDLSFSVYGDGADRDSAVRDFMRSLAETYDLVQLSSDRSDADMRLYNEMRHFVCRVG